MILFRTPEGVGIPTNNNGNSLNGSARDAKKSSQHFLPGDDVTITRLRNSSSKKRRREELRILLAICLFVAAIHQISVVDLPQSPANWVFASRHLFSADLDTTGDISTYANGKKVSRCRTSLEVEPYTSSSALRTNQKFHHALMLIVFDSPSGTLLTFADKHFSFNRFRGNSPSYILSRALMQNFPERFQVGREPFQILFTSADLPPTSWWQHCLIEKLHTRFCSKVVKDFAPIVTFGSAPKDACSLPSLCQFPLTTFMSCLERDKCDMTKPIKGEQQWNYLKPQIVWRGSDFPMLTGMGFQNWSPGRSQEGVHSVSASKDEMVEILLQHYNTLTPRWKAVALSLKANLDANKEGRPVSAWIDAKFLKNPHTSTHDLSQEFLKRFKEYSVLLATKRRMGEKETSQYKYQLDIAGGGGTTWTGTLRKLAMPGLLFHHETPTRDFFYDEIKPWVHYVPVKTDLSDLREKYDWAESHQEEAQMIAKAATDYVAKMATDGWINQTYKKYFVEDLGRIVKAYQPTEGENIASVLDGYKNSMPDFRSLKLYLTCTSSACTYKVPFSQGKKTFSNDQRKFV